MKNLVIIFLFLTVTIASFAQNNKFSKKDFTHNPVWISMISDTSVNFFEAEKAFNTYFLHHEKPDGEHEIIGEYQKFSKNPSKRERKKLQEKEHLRMEVKKYERWHQRMLPYVQADGHILTPSQRLQIWASQKTNK